jgi:hypothetical protein
MILVLTSIDDEYPSVNQYRVFSSAIVFYQIGGWIIAVTWAERAGICPEARGSLASEDDLRRSPSDKDVKLPGDLH